MVDFRQGNQFTAVSWTNTFSQSWSNGKWAILYRASQHLHCSPKRFTMPSQLPTQQWVAAAMQGNANPLYILTFIYVKTLYGRPVTCRHCVGDVYWYVLIYILLLNGFTVYIDSDIKYKKTLQMFLSSIERGALKSSPVFRIRLVTLPVCQWTVSALSLRTRSEQDSALIDYV